MLKILSTKIKYALKVLIGSGYTANELLIRTLAVYLCYYSIEGTHFNSWFSALN